MKVLRRDWAARLPWLRPLIITAAGLGCVLGFGVADYFTPDPISFVLFYMLVVVLVGRHAGKWHAVFVSGVAVITMATMQWGLGRGAPQTVWVLLWNNSTRFLVFSIAGWLTAEVTRLTRHLSDLVEERTAQWKTEVEHHRSTSTRLGEALERFEQVINNISEVFWLTDVSKNQMAYISPGYERVWGRKCEEVYREPRSWTAAIHPADRDEVLRRARTDQATGSYDVEYRILRPDGAVRWIRDRAFPVRNEQGEVYRIAGIAQDITERKQTREVLQTQAAIIESMAEGVVVTDEQGVIVQMNPASERIWGYEHNEVVGQPVSVFSGLPEPEAAAVMEEVLAGLQATGSWRGTFKNRRKDGAIIFCEAVMSRLELKGRMLMVAVEQDVTERVRAQEQLQIQARVLESMAEAMMMVDETGTILLTNPAQDALLGYERGELVGKSMLVLAGYSPEDYHRRFGRHVEEVKANGFAAGDYVARRKDGTMIEVQTRSNGMSVGGRFRMVIVGQDITERKQREQALRQSEETLRVFLDALPEPALLLDREGTILLANRALAHSLGVPESKLAGQYAFGLIPLPVAEIRKAMFDQVLRTRKPAHYEDTRAGRHFLNIQSPVLDAAGNSTRVALFALEITERKQAETVLRESEQTYRALVETTGTGYLILDLEGRVLDANAEYVRLSGHKTLPQILGRGVKEWTAPNDLERNAAAIEECLKTGAVRNLEIEYAGPDGLITQVEINSTAVHVGKGRTILSLCRNITQRKQVETALARQEALYRTLFELSPDGILLEDTNGQILDANQALCRSFGYSRGELLHQNVRWFVPPERQGEVETHLAELRAGQTLEHEVWNLRKDGERRLMRLNEKPLALPDGRQGILVVTRDITESKRAQTTKEVFLTLGEKLCSVSTPVEAARAIYASADQLWQWDAATLSLYSQESDVMESVLFCDVMDGQRCELPPPFPPGLPTVGRRRIMREGPELILRKEGDLSGPYNSRFGDVSRPSASIMYVPMRRDGQAVGVLSIQSYTPDAYRQEDLRTLQALAEYCAGALERIRVEQALQQREEVNRTILATAMDGFYALDFAADPGGAIVAVNDAYCRLIGYSREELRRMRMADLEATETPEDVARHKTSIMAAGADRFETRHRRKDGEEIQVEISLSSLAGSGERVFGFVRDITERKRAELAKEAFLSLGAQLSTASSPVEAGRAVYATADQFWKWDSATLDLCSAETGGRVQTVLNCDVVDGRRCEVPPADPAGSPSPRLLRIMRDGAELILEERPTLPPDILPFGDSSRLSASMMYVPLRREGQPVGLLSIQSYTPNAFTPEDLRTLQALADFCVGALERIRAEAALRESEERYRSLVNNLNVGVYRNTPGSHGRFLHANPALARMHGYDSVEEFQKVRVADLYQVAGERKAFVAELLRQGSVVNYELRLKKKGGTPIYGSINATAHRGPNGELDWIDGTLEDITERKKAERSLAEALELNRTLVSASTVGIAAYKASGQCVIANETLTRITGGTIEQLLQQDFRGLKSWRTDGLLAKAELALETGQPQELQARSRTTFGRELVMNAHFSSFTSQGERHLLLMLTDETEAARAQQALRASEERYRALAESSPDAIFILDRDIKVQYVNSRAAALWKCAPEELIGLTQPELFPPEVAKHHYRIAAEVFKTGQPVRRDEPLAFSTGEQWIEIRLVPLFGEQGTVSSVMGVCRDITERKRAERQLAEALDLNQKMIAASVMGIAAYRASGECVFANEALAQTVGGSVSEVQQGNFRRLESWQKSGMLQLAEETLSQGQAQSGEVYTTTSFGKSVWVDCHVAPFVSSGQPHLLLLALDISERKRAEEALRGSDLRLRAIISGAPVMLFAVDRDGIIRFEDGQALKAMGVAPGASLGRSVMEFYAHVPAIIENARRALRGEEFESVVQAGPTTFDCWYSPRRDKDGNPAGHIGVATNITERHRLERQILDISDREQARIGQDIHDGLCQQLVSLAFDANALQRELSAENRPEAKTARRIADFLDQAITESRQLSRGLFPVRLGTVGLSPALQELADGTSARFKIQCRFDGKGPVPVKHAAIATHLYRIAQEAVANAVKHSRAHTVCIQLRTRTNQIELRVEDDGAGVSPAKRKQATGLGLHIMDYRARAVGGTLRIGPGRRGGTIVSCCVPRPRS